MQRITLNSNILFVISGRKPSYQVKIGSDKFRKATENSEQSEIIESILSKFLTVNYNDEKISKVLTFLQLQRRKTILKLAGLRYFPKITNSLSNDDLLPEFLKYLTVTCMCVS